MTTTSKAALSLERGTRRKNTLRAVVRNRYIYALLAPGMIWYAVFCYGPMYGVQLAFKEFMYNKGIWGSPFVGLQKFEYIIHDDMFWRAFRNTVSISFGSILFTFIVPIVLAILINELSDGRFKKVLQTVFTLPHFFSWIIISGIVMNLLNYNGAVNNLLAAIGIEKIGFLGTPDLFRPLLYASSIWKEAGWGTIIYLAAISSIDPTLYEAAVVDGANRFHRIRFITWPGIQSTVIILLILSVGGVMNAGFDQIFNLYNPTVYDKGDIIDTYIYRVTFQSIADFGFSTAVGLFKSVINLTLLLSANRFARLFENGRVF
jgi:putative aldouronate transport system permease protein